MDIGGHREGFKMPEFCRRFYGWPPSRHGSKWRNVRLVTNFTKKYYAKYLTRSESNLTLGRIVAAHRSFTHRPIR